jgi:hypothetical protein
MLEKESFAQEVTEQYLLGKYGEDQRSVVTDARWEEGTYEQDKER